jgi:predicted amidophosphoribosyltransferase
MKKCPHCKKQVKNKDKTCSHCGRPMKIDEETLLAFYTLKAELSDSFFEKNKKDLNILETSLIKEYFK